MRDSLHDEPPFADVLTGHDWLHRGDYRRCLDAACVGADPVEAGAAIFEIDPRREPERAARAFAAHRRRAEWMVEVGLGVLLPASLRGLNPGFPY